MRALLAALACVATATASASASAADLRLARSTEALKRSGPTLASGALDAQTAAGTSGKWHVPLELGDGSDSSVQIKSYDAAAFAALRAGVFNLTDAAFAASLSSGFRVLSSNSKSGMAFVQTADGALILKTQTHHEQRQLRKFLPHYAAHCGAHKGTTLLSEMYGMYRIKPARGGAALRFVVMSNVHAAEGRGTERYDLKGSTYGRKASSKQPLTAETTRKDLDLLGAEAAGLHGLREIAGGCSDALMRRLLDDVVFLAEHRRMDYSLLVGVARPAGADAPPAGRFRLLGRLGRLLRRRRGGGEKEGGDGRLARRGAATVARAGPDVCYSLGMIDYLQEYTARKRLETFFKVCLLRRRGVSCVAPREYALRFLAFVAAALGK